jgi:hypothetical protein
MDGAMTQAPLGGNQGGQYPTDRGKLGTKRRVLTDGGGVPIGLAVEGAHRHDFKMVEPPIMSLPIERPAPTRAQPQGLGLDQGDDDDKEENLCERPRVIGQSDCHRWCTQPPQLGGPPAIGGLGNRQGLA